VKERDKLWLKTLTSLKIELTGIELGVHKPMKVVKMKVIKNSMTALTTGVMLQEVRDISIRKAMIASKMLVT
jgi:hypothetical protein